MSEERGKGGVSERIREEDRDREGREVKEIRTIPHTAVLR